MSNRKKRNGNDMHVFRFGLKAALYIFVREKCLKGSLKSGRNNEYPAWFVMWV